MRTLDTFEEAVVLISLPSGSLLVRMMAQDLLPMGFLDLLVRGPVAVFGKAKYGVVVLSLFPMSDW
jgi:hypothetical protein